MNRISRLAVLPIVLAMSLATSGAAAAVEPTPTSSTVHVVADGLANPRSMLLLPAGVVLVAEAGAGGAECFGTEPDRHCFGTTGGVSLVHADTGNSFRLISDLPSLAPMDGVGAAGISDLAIAHNGQLHGIIGLGDAPAVRDTLGPDGALMGQIVRFNAAGPKGFADLAAFEATHNPDGKDPFTNPYALLPEGKGAIAIDAGGNTMLSVDKDGEVTLLHLFPEEMVPAPPFLGLPPGTMLPMEAVPTSVVVGPDGAYYIGTLGGFPFPTGASKVLRLEPGQQPTVYADGFTTVIGVDFDQQGRLWVLEHTTNGFLSGDPTGALVRVEHDGSHTVVASAGLTRPTGMAVADDGSVYVTNNGTSPTNGQLLRVVP